MKNCRQCDSTNLSVSINTTDIFGDQYQYYKCNHCNTYSIDPFPTDAQFRQAYGDDYYGGNEEKFNPLIEWLLNTYRRKRAKIVTRYLPEHSNILDVGCGNGNFLKYLRQNGNFEIFGVELEGRSAQRARRIPKLTLYVGDFKDIEFKEKFNAISYVHVIEHIDKPFESLEKANSLLMNNGILYISYPNIVSSQAVKYQGNWLHLDPPRHLNFIEPNHLIHYLSQKGYTLIQQRHNSLEYNPFGLIQSWLNSHSSKREILYEWLKGNKSYLSDVKKSTIYLHVLITLIILPFALIINYIDAINKKGACIELVFRKNQS